MSSNDVTGEWMVPDKFEKREEGKRELRFDNGDRLLLSIDKSLIPNSGRGLFLEYLGPRSQLYTTHLMDLGVYAPIDAQGIKKKNIMELKNFLFEQHPSEWSYHANFTGEKTKENLFGVELDQELFYDVTKNSDGRLHECAKSSLLPYANESTPEMQRRQRTLLPNMTPCFHKDGTLHYIILKDRAFLKNEKTELLVYYGKEYQDVRDRKEYEISEVSQEKNIFICVHCKHYWKSSNPDPLSEGYISIRKSISSFSESQVYEVLQYCLLYPPEPSSARRRMWWLVEQIRLYCHQLLYQQQNGVLPDLLLTKIEEALLLYPRINHALDLQIRERHQYLGEGVRMLRGDKWLNGFIESFADDSQNIYKVVFVNGDVDLFHEEELEDCFFNGGYGAL